MKDLQGKLRTVRTGSYIFHVASDLLGAEFPFICSSTFSLCCTRVCQNLRCSDFSFRLVASVSSFCQGSALFCLIELKTINVGFVLALQIDFECLQVLG